MLEQSHDGNELIHNRPIHKSGIVEHAIEAMDSKWRDPKHIFDIAAARHKQELPYIFLEEMRQGKTEPCEIRVNITAAYPKCRIFGTGGNHIDVKHMEEHSWHVPRGLWTSWGITCVRGRSIDNVNAASTPVITS